MLRHSFVRLSVYGTDFFRRQPEIAIRFAACKVIRPETADGLTRSKKELCHHIIAEVHAPLCQPDPAILPQEKPFLSKV